jgi:16S rRNA (cytosine1402-N4)-methyltransferase
LPGLLKPDGYAAIISFHSLEDRIVKENFNKCKKDNIYEVVTKKPLTASKEEIRKNPRSRSAKLRIAKRLQ